MREVFDYKPGDIFQYTDEVGSPYSMETYKIISRTYSNNQDTINYYALKTIFYRNDSIPVSHDTVKLVYANLDSTIFDYIPRYRYDSIAKNGGYFERYDTINEYSTFHCQNLVNGFQFGNFEFGTRYLFGKGLGIVEVIIGMDYPGMYWTLKRLSYFKKSDFECGKLFITNVDKLNTLESIIKLYPNPAQDILTMEINSNEQIFGFIKIHDILGELILGKSFENNIKIDVTDLPVGVYILSITIDKSIIYKRIIIH